MEFWKDNIHKARKMHRCELCNQNIEIGERYHRQSGNYEGEFFDRCLHVRCNKIIDTFCIDNQTDEYSDELIIDWLSDAYCYYCEDKKECGKNILECNLILENFK